MPGSPHLDGAYLEPALAQVWPSAKQVTPFVVNGQFKTDRPCGELTPMLWLTLQRYGIPVRGPAVADLGIRVDQEQLRRYNLDNLREYWKSKAAMFPAAPADVAPDQVMDAETVSWFVLGPARLHYTLARSSSLRRTWSRRATVSTRWPMTRGAASPADLLQRGPARYRLSSGSSCTSAKSSVTSHRSPSATSWFHLLTAPSTCSRPRRRPPPVVPRRVRAAR